MKRLLCLALLFCSAALVTSASQADILFSFRQQGGAVPITIGNAAIFDIVTVSTVAGQIIDGFDLGLTMGNQTGAGGILVAGTLGAGLTSGNWFAGSFPGFTPTASFGLAAFTYTVANTTEYVAGTVTLDTSAGVAGTYALNYDPANMGLASPAGPPPFQVANTTYTLVAIPEPATGAVLGLVFVAGIAGRRRRLASI